MVCIMEVMLVIFKILEKKKKLCLQIGLEKKKNEMMLLK